MLLWLENQNQVNKYRQKLQTKQNNVCAVTGITLIRPVLDHNHQTGKCRNVIESKINMVEGKYLKIFNKYLAKHYDFDFGEFLIMLGEYINSETTDSPLHFKIIEVEKRRVSKWKIEVLKNKLNLPQTAKYSKQEIVNMWIEQFIKQKEHT